jgi:hypothetical protein
MSIKQSTQFSVKKITFFTDFYSFDLTGVYQEINLYDNMFFPCMTGNIVIGDSAGIASSLILNGSEYITFVMSKDDGYLEYERTFKVYSVTDRQSINQTSQAYIINFISPEYITSMQKRLNRSFSGLTHSEMALTILADILKVGGDRLAPFSETKGEKTEIIPNLRPLDAINWLTKRSVDKNFLPNLVFFENVVGYNFVSLSDITSFPVVATFNEQPKNLNDDNFPTAESMSSEILGLREFRVDSQFNIIDNIDAGVYAGTFLGFDLVTKSFAKREVDFLDTYGKGPVGQHGNPNLPLIRDNKNNYLIQNFNTRKVLYPAELERSNSKYIIARTGKTAEENTASRFNSEETILQRKSIFKNFLTKKVSGVVPGNFGVTSGFNINIKTQDRNVVENQDNIDPTTYGKYTIISARHIIGYDRHETVFEAVTDSLVSSNLEK